MEEHQKKVIIFDDDEDILSVCTAILEQQGWKVFTFTDCNDIIQKVSKIHPDIIFMDNWIPDTGGVFATQVLKNSETYKHIPVIYFSANNDINSLALRAGAETFLAKPFEIADLTRVINDALAN